MRKLYLAAPLFSEAEKAFNKKLKTILSQKFEVFLPQEDGKLLVELLAAGMSRSDAETEILETDIKALKEAEIIFAILDGRTIDEGVSFELGAASILGKECIALQTDPRRLLPSGNNPMLSQIFSKTFSSTEEVESWVQGL